MAKAASSQKTDRHESSPILRLAIFGRWVPVDFFMRNWLVVFGVVAMFMVYMTNRYTCQTKMEQIKKLEVELEVAKTERIRAKSAYMSRIRESSMQHLADSLRLGLTVQEQPPYTLSRKK